MAKAGGEAIAKLKDDMLYHDIELEATRAMLEDASKSIGFFSMPDSDEYKPYVNTNIGNVDEIVKRVIEMVNNNQYQHIYYLKLKEFFININDKLKCMWHGGDYNPDQWLKHPEEIEKDVELMKKPDSM